MNTSTFLEIPLVGSAPRPSGTGGALLRPGQLRGTPVSGVTLTEGRWLHRMWCALVDSQVPDLSIRGVEVVRRMQDLARRLICEWTEDEVVKTFR